MKPDFAVSGNSFTYAGAQVRVALSADATQDVVTVKSAAPNYTAAFTDERGVIYTAKRWNEAAGPRHLTSIAHAVSVVPDGTSRCWRPSIM